MKYKTEVEGGMLRIIAVKDFANVKAGDRGGRIEKDANLSQDGDAWVSGDARVFGDARVSGDAQVSGNAWVSGDNYITISNIGSRKTTTVITSDKDRNVLIITGCFCGGEKEFKARVNAHTNDQAKAEYKALVYPAIKLIKERIKKGGAK